MQVRKALKKALAIGAGLSMVGATMMGAMAATFTLADYPAPFVKDGKFDGLIVIGDQAKSSDVVGAIDVANSLQYSMQQKSTVNVGGTSSTTISDGFKIETQGQKLYYGDALSARRTTVTGSDVDMLADLKVSHEDNGDEYTYRQSVILGGSAPKFGVPPSSSNTDPVAYLDWSNAETYTLQIEFPKAVEIGNLTDEAMTLFGQEVVVSGNSGELSATKMTVYGGGNDVTIAAGESQTIKSGDSTLNVEVIGINTQTATSKATVKVNGESKEVTAQKTYTIGGERIYIKDIFAYTTPVTSGAVRMFVGSDKIVLEDTQEVTKGKGDDAISGTTVSFVSGGTNKVSKVLINVTPSSMDDDVDFQVAGDSFTDPVFGGFKFVFAGMNPAIGSSERDVIKLYASGNEYMNLMFTNRDGDVFDGRFFFGNNTNNTALAYDADTKFTVGKTVMNNATGYGCAAILNEDHDDFFIIDDGQGHSHVLQLLSITASASEKKIRVKDVASGTTLDHSFSEDATQGFKGSMYYNGFEYVFYVFNGSFANTDAISPLFWDPQYCSEVTTANAEKLMVVNNGLILDNAVDTAAGVAGFYTKGGALITPLFFNDTLQTGVGNPTWLRSNALQISEETDWNEEEAPDDQTSLNATITYDSSYSGSGKRIKVSNTVVGVTLNSWDSDSDVDSGLTPFGTYVQVNSDNDDLYVEYPTVQAFFDVFVAPLAATTSNVGSGGNVETVTIDRIQVGAAKLASEVNDLTAQNIIVVGGPCVNSAASFLMGDPVDCTTGFEPGKAMIKLYTNGNKVALLVAGYSAVDTRRATSVLADYSTYKNTLTGMEVEVKQGTGSTTMVSAVTEQE